MGTNNRNAFGWLHKASRSREALSLRQTVRLVDISSKIDPEYISDEEEVIEDVQMSSEAE